MITGYVDAQIGRDLVLPDHRALAHVSWPDSNVSLEGMVRFRSGAAPGRRSIGNERRFKTIADGVDQVIIQGPGFVWVRFSAPVPDSRAVGVIASDPLDVTIAYRAANDDRTHSMSRRSFPANRRTHARERSPRLGRCSRRKRRSPDASWRREAGGRPQSRRGWRTLGARESRAGPETDGKRRKTFPQVRGWLGLVPAGRRTGRIRCRSRARTRAGAGADGSGRSRWCACSRSTSR